MSKIRKSFGIRSSHYLQHRLSLRKKEAFTEPFAIFQKPVCGTEDPRQRLAWQITALLALVQLKEAGLLPERLRTTSPGEKQLRKKLHVCSRMSKQSTYTHTHKLVYLGTYSDTQHLK